MRLLLCALLVSLVAVLSAIAQDSPVKADTADRVQIIEDDALGAVRILIDGKEVARIDGSGLHVRDNVKYDGVISDTGPDGFGRHIAGEQP